jgi:hypothetical protein
VAELKAICKERKLKIDGIVEKEDLVEKLRKKLIDDSLDGILLSCC